MMGFGMNGIGGYGGTAGLGGLAGLLTLLVVVVAVVYLARRVDLGKLLSAHTDEPAPRQDEALTILRERLASGAIDADEYGRLRHELE